MTATGELALTEREELETNLIRALIASYFSIVRQTIQDLVPKAIMRASPPLSPSLPSLTRLFRRRPPRQLLARVDPEQTRREPVQGHDV